MAVDASFPEGGKRSYRVEALAKGLKILSLFSEDRSSLRLKAIVELSGISMPTAFRLVSTLEEDGYLERNLDGSFRLGVSVLALSSVGLRGRDLVEAAQPTIKALADRLGETVNLGVLVADQVLFVGRAEQPHSLVAANIRVGSVVPAVFSSIGKIILAYLEPEEFDRRISNKSFSGEWGPRAVLSLAELKKQLAAGRRQGYIVQYEEAVARLSSIAAPVRQAGLGVVAAVNIAVPAAEYDEARILRELRGPLLEACDVISGRLGVRFGPSKKSG